MYKSSSDEERQVLLDLFMQYLIAVSWRKMDRSMSNWSNSSFLYCLCRIRKDELLKAFNTLGSSWDDAQNEDTDGDVQSNEASNRKDLVLVNAVTNMTDQHACDLTEGVPSEVPITQENCQLKKLRQAMENAGDDALKFYNKDTYEEFHILLISTLFKFRKAL
jgi:hypothetical protein